MEYPTLMPIHFQHLQMCETLFALNLHQMKHDMPSFEII